MVGLSVLVTREGQPILKAERLTNVLDLFVHFTFANPTLDDDRDILWN